MKHSYLVLLAAALLSISACTMRTENEARNPFVFEGEIPVDGRLVIRQ